MLGSGKKMFWNAERTRTRKSSATLAQRTQKNKEESGKMNTAGSRESGGAQRSERLPESFLADGRFVVDFQRRSGHGTKLQNGG